jgi:hypothetical protein
MADILFSLRLRRHSLATVNLADSHGMEILQPTIASLCQLNIEHASIDNLSHRNFAIVALNDLSAMVQLLDQAANGVAARSIHSIDLVQNNNVCELDLVDHEVRNGSFVFRSDIVSAS